VTISASGQKKKRLPSVNRQKPSVNSQELLNLSTLFGVAYREEQRFLVPPLGNLGNQKKVEVRQFQLLPALNQKPQTVPTAL
jgi:hypothetical protein